MRALPARDRRRAPSRPRSEPRGLSWHASAEDLYPDALPCLRSLADLGYRLGVAANQPAEAAEVVRTLGVDFELVGMSAAWGLHKPDPAFFARIAEELSLAARRHRLRR